MHIFIMIAYCIMCVCYKASKIIYFMLFNSVQSAIVSVYKLFFVQNNNCVRPYM